MDKIKDKGRFHVMPYGSGMITICKDMASVIPFNHKERLMVEYDEENKILTVSQL